MPVQRNRRQYPLQKLAGLPARVERAVVAQPVQLCNSREQPATPELRSGDLAQRVAALHDAGSRHVSPCSGEDSERRAGKTPEFPGISNLDISR